MRVRVCVCVVWWGLSEMKLGKLPEHSLEIEMRSEYFYLQEKGESL